MGWFSSKENVPEIPPAPVLPTVQKYSNEKKDLPDLPSFPLSSQNSKLDQEMVKSAVSDSSGENEVGENDFEELQVEEMGIPSYESILSKPEVASIPSKKTANVHQTKKAIEIGANFKEKPATKSLEPIFVRVDKFQTAQKDLDQIKDKIEEIDSVIKKIKGVKSKEEQELNAWGDEIEKLKSRLADIDSNLFNQM